MQRDLITFLLALSATASLGGCSSNAPDQASDNQSGAPAAGAQAAKPVGTSSELDKMLDAPIDPAEDGIVNLDARISSNTSEQQKPAKAP